MVTLVVEDGTGLPDSGANTYVTEAETASYMESLGRTAWEDLDDPTIQIYQAAQQMEARYKTLWKGKKRLSDNDPDNPTANDPLNQALSWPRKDVTDEDGVAVDRTTIPAVIKTAQMEIAWLLSQNISFVESQLSRQDTGVIREKVGPIDIMYQENAQGAPTYPFLDQLLEPLLTAPSGSKTFVSIGFTDEELNKINETADLDPADFPEYFISI